jgi:hypothetical protein
MDLVLSGVAISNITIYIKKIKINVKYKTIYNLRNEHIQQLLDSCMGNLHGNSVDKLIALFKQTKNVSFVYLLHKYNSGFLTFHKNPRDKDEQVLKLLNHNVGYDHESIHQ